MYDHKYGSSSFIYIVKHMVLNQNYRDLGESGYFLSNFYFCENVQLGQTKSKCLQDQMWCDTRLFLKRIKKKALNKGRTQEWRRSSSPTGLGYRRYASYYLVKRIANGGPWGSHLNPPSNGGQHLCGCCACVPHLNFL